jgi:HEAT repeat protein
MNQGLQRTVQLLTTTRNLAAVDVLLPALDSPEASVRRVAVEALLERKNLAGQMAILRRLDALDEPTRQVVRHFGPTLGRALRTALVDDDLELRTAACRAIRWLGEYDFVPLLVGALEYPNQPLAGMLVETLLELLKSFKKSSIQGADGSPRPSKGRANDTVQQRILHCLEGAAERFEKHRRDQLIEAFFFLADAANPLVQTILGHPEHGCHKAAVRVLSTSTLNGLWQLAIELLRQDHPPAGLAAVIATRGDAGFVRFLLGHVGERLSHRAIQMLGRLEKVAWLAPGHPALLALDAEGVGRAIRFLSLCGLRRQERFDVLADLVDHAPPGGREAAVNELAQLNGEDVNRLLLRCADDVDPGVQAAATSRLRSRCIPGALGLLLSKLESPHEAVRQAAREALNEYRFSRFLAAFDQLDEAACRRAGQLIKKIDPETVPLLRAEFDSPGRSHRLRALRIAETMELIDDVQGKLVELLGDDAEDGVVRTEAARLLAGSTSASVIQALETALSGANARVRSQAELSLEQILRRSNAHEAAPAPDG